MSRDIQQLGLFDAPAPAVATLPVIPLGTTSAQPEPKLQRCPLCGGHLARHEPELVCDVCGMVIER